MDQEALFEGVGAAGDARDKLRDSQRYVVFVAEYVKCGNATQSAKEAGFSKKTATSQGSRLLQMPEIQRAIKHERARLRMENPDLSADRLLRELGCIAFSDRRDLFDDKGNVLKVYELDEPTARAITSIDVEETETATEDKVVRRRNHRVRLGDKRGAIELIARIQGLMKDRVELSGSVRQLSDDELAAKLAAHGVQLGSRASADAA